MLNFKKQSWPIFPRFRVLFHYGDWKSFSHMKEIVFEQQQMKPGKLKFSKLYVHIPANMLVRFVRVLYKFTCFVSVLRNFPV